jgi:hypothetical protein
VVANAHTKVDRWNWAKFFKITTPAPSHPFFALGAGKMIDLSVPHG